MRAVTWRGLVAHKLRFALTTLAIVLGVAFVAGSLMLTDTIERSFTTVVTETAGGVDVTVRPEGRQAAFEGGFDQREPQLVRRKPLDGDRAHRYAPSVFIRSSTRSAVGAPVTSS
jgi:hypothetical protein